MKGVNLNGGRKPQNISELSPKWECAPGNSMHGTDFDPWASLDMDFSTHATQLRMKAIDLDDVC